MSSPRAYATRFFAKAVVIEAGDQKLALVGLDLGRSPDAAMMDRIRAAVKATSGVTFVMLSGSHTHHGPVLEMQDKEGMGKGKFDDAVAYVKTLEGKLIAVINEAAGSAQDARIGSGSAMVDRNRNRHKKFEPKPTDPELSVIRFDDLSGTPIALIINFSAHPTMLSGEDLRFSAEWPGQMMYAVEAGLGPEDDLRGLLQRPPHALPHHRRGLRRRLWRGRHRELGTRRRGRTDDGQGSYQPLHHAGKIRAEAVGRNTRSL